VSVTYYASGRLKRLQTLPQILENETKNGIRRGQNRLRTALFDEFRAGGIGRAIFGSTKKGAAKTVIARERIQKNGETYEVGIRIKGIAAIVERGGRTMRHAIGQAGKILSNPAAGFFAKGQVNHPGAQMKRDDFAGRAVAKVRSAFRAEVEKGVAKAAAVVNNG